MSGSWKRGNCSGSLNGVGVSDICYSVGRADVRGGSGEDAGNSRAPSLHFDPQSQQDASLTD